MWKWHMMYRVIHLRCQTSAFSVIYHNGRPALFRELAGTGAKTSAIVHILLWEATHQTPDRHIHTRQSQNKVRTARQPEQSLRCRQVCGWGTMSQYRRSPLARPLQRLALPVDAGAHGLRHWRGREGSRRERPGRGRTFTCRLYLAVSARALVGNRSSVGAESVGGQRVRPGTIISATPLTKGLYHLPYAEVYR